MEIICLTWKCRVDISPTTSFFLKLMICGFPPHIDSFPPQVYYAILDEKTIVKRFIFGGENVECDIITYTISYMYSVCFLCSTNLSFIAGFFNIVVIAPRLDRRTPLLRISSDGT